MVCCMLVTWSPPNTVCVNLPKVKFVDVDDIIDAEK